MQNMTQRSPLITKNYISAHQKINFRSKFLGLKLRWKKFHWNRKIDLATNAEYYSTKCANHEKLYFTPTKNQFLRLKLHDQKLRLKKLLWNWKIELAKNAEYDSAWCANQEKLYLSPKKKQFLRSKFLGQKLRLKSFFEIRK